jgi:hypothetical protein
MEKQGMPITPKVCADLLRAMLLWKGTAAHGISWK